MQQHYPKKGNNTPKQVQNTKSQKGKQVQKKGAKIETTLFQRSDNYLNSKYYTILVILFAIFVTQGLALFDQRFSMAGDDTSYVERAFNFIHHFTFPGFQGPVYPIVLSPFVAMFGLNPIPLKFISMLFLIGFLFVFIRSLKNRIPSVLLTGTCILIVINSFILYYGSQTYSEALFMLLQALTIMVFFHFFVDDNGEKSSVTLVKQHLLLVLCLIILGLTRSIGFSASIAVALWFLIQKQWKNILFLVTGFILLLIFFKISSLVFFSHPTHLITNFTQGLFSKDYYNPTLGRETFLGFVHRFLFNSNYYLSVSLFTVFGFRDPNGTGELMPILTIISYALLVLAIILSFRKNQYLFFIGIYTLITLVIIFFIAHTIWIQMRFIIPYFPLIALLFLSCIHYFLEIKRWKNLQFLFPLIIIIFFGASTIATSAAVKEARKITDKYSGLTPDMENYCRMSEWVGVNIPKNEVIACRKPSISFIFSQSNNFFGITRFPFCSGDSLIQTWQRKQLNYYLLPLATPGLRKISLQLSKDLKNYLVGFGISVKNKYYHSRFFMFDLPLTTRPTILKKLNDINVNLTNNLDTLRLWVKDTSLNISIVYPDSVLRTLYRAHVSYVLTDKLRFISTQKNEKMSSTVEMFMNFIEVKYPGIRSKINQVGNDDEEPATLYKINYELAGLPALKN
jgi:hypothetical protein